jgi:hypothetical protein
MIFSDSRYATANVYKAFTPKLGGNSVVVLREFPFNSSAFFYYIWRDGDRVENVAANLLEDSNLWWKIMDFNPEIANPFSISIGTIVRIPYDQ